MTSSAKRNGDGRGVGNPLDGAGSHGMSHGTAAAKIRESSASGNHGLEKSPLHGIRAGIPASRCNGYSTPLVGFLLKGADHFHDAGVNIKAVDSAEATGKQFLGRSWREAGWQAKDDDIRIPPMFEQFVKARKVRHAAQVVGRCAHGSGTSDNADTLGIRHRLQRTDNTAANIAKTENGSLKRH